MVRESPRDAGIEEEDKKRNSLLLNTPKNVERLLNEFHMGYPNRMRPTLISGKSYKLGRIPFSLKTVGTSLIATYNGEDIDYEEFINKYEAEESEKIQEKEVDKLLSQENPAY